MLLLLLRPYRGFFVFGERISDANICKLFHDMGFDEDIFDEFINNIVSANAFSDAGFHRFLKKMLKVPIVELGYLPMDLMMLLLLYKALELGTPLVISFLHFCVLVFFEKRKVSLFLMILLCLKFLK